MKLYANLHLHSTHSDGKYDPTTLAQIAHDEGYKAAVLTDHDVASGTGEFREACAKLGMESFLGTEFNALTDLFMRPNGKKGAFHITAYHFDPEYPEMKEYLRQMSLRETDQTRVLFERGLKIGYLHDITWDEVLEFNKGITWLCNEHVFRAMKAKGLATDMDYRPFFENLFGKHRSEVPRLYNYKDVDEIIDLVHRAGGIALVAHPAGQLQYVDALIEMGIDGLEVWHRLLSEEEKKEAYDIGMRKGLYISGGSDHDGLCGGEYETFADPKSSPFYVEPLSTGTTQLHFEEIRDRKLYR